jgi:hypothetical protein
MKILTKKEYKTNTKENINAYSKMQILLQEEKKIIEKPLNQSLDLTPLNRFIGSIIKARKIKLATRPTQGSNTLVLRA